MMMEVGGVTSHIIMVVGEATSHMMKVCVATKSTLRNSVRSVVIDVRRYIS